MVLHSWSVDGAVIYHLSVNSDLSTINNSCSCSCSCGDVLGTAAAEAAAAQTNVVLFLRRYGTYIYQVYYMTISYV